MIGNSQNLITLQKCLTACFGFHVEQRPIPCSFYFCNSPLPFLIKRIYLMYSGVISGTGALYYFCCINKLHFIANLTCVLGLGGDISACGPPGSLSCLFVPTRESHWGYSCCSLSWSFLNVKFPWRYNFLFEKQVPHFWLFGLCVCVLLFLT
jgi:hypothetical protein